MPDATLCPFLSKPFFPEARIERICTEALEAEGLMPTEPEAIRIDRFIEKRFAITIGYGQVSFLPLAGVVDQMWPQENCARHWLLRCGRSMSEHQGGI